MAHSRVHYQDIQFYHVLEEIPKWPAHPVHTLQDVPILYKSYILCIADHSGETKI